MPEAGNVARRYAAGIFQLAQEENAIDSWRAELAKLDELLADDVLVAAFQNPAVGIKRRMELAKLLAPELKPETENLLRLLVEHHRTRYMHEIRQAFQRLAPIRGGHHAKAGLVQHHGEHLPDVVVVVDDENGGPGLHVVP